jgi:hypothetical protein
MEKIKTIIIDPLQNSLVLEFNSFEDRAEFVANNCRHGFAFQNMRSSATGLTLSWRFSDFPAPLIVAFGKVS